MVWLKEHGVISNWWEYDQLPFSVKEDCHLLMEYEEQRQAQEDRKARIAEARRGSG